MSPSEPIGQIELAETCIRDASRLWGRGAAAEYGECCNLLRNAVDAMEGVRKAARTGRLSSADLGTRLENLRAAIDRTARMVDSSAAFWNGLALRVDPGAGPMDSRNGSPALYGEA